MFQAREPLSSDRAEQHRPEREETDEDHGDGDEIERRLDRSLLEPGDGLEGASPEVAEYLPVLMRRDEERHDAGSDQRQAEIPGRFREYRPALPQLGEALEELDDREAEPDQRHRGSQPRHERALHAQPGADPREVAVRGYPDLEPGVIVGHRPSPYPSSWVTGCRSVEPASSGFGRAGFSRACPTGIGKFGDVDNQPPAPAGVPPAAVGTNAGEPPPLDELLAPTNTMSFACYGLFTATAIASRYVA